MNDDDFDDPHKFYEYWSHLAEADPKEFERRRKEEVEKIILSAPENRQLSLRQLQWRIDMERAKATNPISGMIRLNKMMWDSVYDDEGFYSTIADWAHVLEIIKSSFPKKNAPIFLFKNEDN